MQVGNSQGTLVPNTDFAGPFQGQTFLVVADMYSKWLEIVLMASITSEAIIRNNWKLLATHGLPDIVVSNNGPQLTSTLFEMFLAGHGIRHALIAPFHPSSNGQVERTVCSTKEALAKMGPEDWQVKIARYLLVQHAMRCPLTNHSPAKLLMGRRLRTNLDRLHPSYSPEKSLDLTGKIWSFKKGDLVYARNYAGNPLWLPGKVVEVTGLCSYRVELEDGRMWRHHIDQLRGRRSTMLHQYLQP